MENKEKMVNNKKEVFTFFKSLFEFSESFLLKFIYFIHIIIQVIVFVFYFIIIFTTIGWLWLLGWIVLVLGWIVLYPLAFFVVRFIFELISIQFSINDNLVAIKKNLKK